jgi:hypothetical protein
MDYKAMWEGLKNKLNADLDYYVDGRMCSFSEAIHGAAQAEDMLRAMATIESKYNHSLQVRGNT